MNELFDAPAATTSTSKPAAAERVDVDFNLETAKRMGKLPDGWMWWHLEAGLDPMPGQKRRQRLPAGMILVKGCVPSEFYTKGARAGSPNFSKPVPGTEREIMFPREQIAETRAIYERTTGKCSSCCGYGTRQVGYSVASGPRFEPCGRCGATGEAPTGETAVPA